MLENILQTIIVMTRPRLFHRPYSGRIKSC